MRFPVSPPLLPKLPFPEQHTVFPAALPSRPNATRPPASIDISQKKARTVALFNGAFTTAALYNMTQPGQPLFAIEETNGGLIVFGGGIPIFLDGHFIGAVGVSGGTTDQDITVATAGVEALTGAVS